MKAKEIRQMSSAEIRERLVQERENLGQMRFQLTTSQLTNTALVAQTRHDIARMLGILHERQKSGETT
jgi:large subunit ribosomal protein L29